MQCGSGQYDVSDMQDLMLAAGGALNHVFSPLQEGRQQQYQQSLQQPQEMFELYHRQASLQQEHHLSPAELQGTHVLFGFHHLPQKAMDAHLSISHQMSLGSESSGELAISSLAARRTASLTSHDHVAHYIKRLPTSGRPKSTIDTTVEEYSELGADIDADKGALSSSRWPQEETLALLQIRFEMDALFRDSLSKGSLWEEVSRKLHDVGYQRSAKKCKEKFENLHKYYKKTRDSKPEKQEGKAYRFHTEMEAIYSASQAQETEAAMVVPDGVSNALFSAAEGNVTLQARQETDTSPRSSSSTSCGNAAHAEVKATECGSKRKRNSWLSMRTFFDALAKQLMDRQEALHKKFLEVLERREEERERREEAYKRQEMARTRREQELRAQEQAMAATRDAALVAFLQKVTGETLHLPETTPSEADAARGCINGGEAGTPSGGGGEPSEMKESSSRRWPKVEVLALIRVRTSLEPRFQEAGPKSQLWEEVSSTMASLGFTRSGKRCKEKWENINKYYRKTKDNAGRKLRPESAATKTCPYFHHLKLLYERGILTLPNNSSALSKSATRVDPPAQTSGEFLENNSKDDTSQQTGSHPPPHLREIAYEQAHGDGYTSNRGRAEVREMMEIRQHHHHHQQQHLQRSTGGHLFEREQLVGNHKYELAARMEMQNSAEEQDLEHLRMHQQEDMSRLDHEGSHRDSAALMMALVHKLASGDGHPSDFDLSSPASPES